MPSKVRPDARLSWDRILNREGHVVVRIRSDVLDSDEAIVGVLQHEVHELASLREMMDEADGLTAREIAVSVAPRRAGNLHDQAWDIADLRVQVMRAAPGSSERRALEERMERFEDNLRARNLGGGQP
jgi:hypothetical protein